MTDFLVFVYICIFASSVLMAVEIMAFDLEGSSLIAFHNSHLYPASANCPQSTHYDNVTLNGV